MNCNFIKVWEVNTSDGYFSKPVAHFSSKDQASLWLLSQKDGAYMNISKEPLEGIQVGSKTWLLGKSVDLNHAEESEREKLINSAKKKLSPDELEALLKR